LADGLNNLYQAVQNRLLTPVGTLPLHPTYGSQLHTLIGKGSHPLIATSAKMMVVEALQPETRIAYIKNFQVDFERTKGIITIIVEIVSVFSTELNINLQVGA
jgi:phage baseplate assembly protein W